MQPWYKKKKIWVAAVTAAGSILAAVTDNKDLADKLMLIGMTLIGALGLEDLGKAKDAGTGNLGG